MQPPYPPSHPRRIVLQTLIIALLALAVTMLASTRVDAQAPAYRLASSDIGVAPGLVTADTRVLSPAGTSAGPAAVDSFVDSLRHEYPGARFQTGEVYVYSGLMIVDWQGTIDDTVAVVNGRTLIGIDDGRITRVTFLNLSEVAPIDGAPVLNQ
jgi:hypothetical protein